MDNNHADALLNMELEKKLQNRVRELVLNDHELIIAVGNMLANDKLFLKACQANADHYRQEEYTWRY